MTEKSLPHVSHRQAARAVGKGMKLDGRREGIARTLQVGGAIGGNQRRPDGGARADLRDHQRGTWLEDDVVSPLVERVAPRAAHAERPVFGNRDHLRRDAQRQQCHKHGDYLFESAPARSDTHRNPTDLIFSHGAVLLFFLAASRFRHGLSAIRRYAFGNVDVEYTKSHAAWQ